MKVIINERGNLSIERAGKMKEQICPHTYTDDDTFSYCGDWCPLFREPIFEDHDRQAPWFLQICDMCFKGEPDELEDRRNKANNRGMSMNKSTELQTDYKLQETAASEVMTLTAYVAHMAENIADDLCMKLEPVMRSVSPVGKNPVEDKEYPQLFKDWATFMHSIEHSLEIIEGALRRVDL